MRTYKITSKNQKTLFEGTFSSFTECLEIAVKKNTDLSHADLKHKNLTNINIDDARLSHADFTGANLSGANMSEARLNGANFTNAALYNSCMAYSDMRHCQFNQTSFGATDITGSDISFSHFAGQYCFSLTFINTRAMQGCTFQNTSGATIITSRPPIVILGLSPNPIVLTSNQIDHHNRSVLA